MDSVERLLSEGSSRVPPDLIPEGDLASGPRSFLTKVGLPTKPDLFFPFLAHSDTFAVFGHLGTRYLAIADEEGGQRLGVRLPDGAVVIVDEHVARPRVVNSGPEQLVMSLAVYEDIRESVLEERLSGDDGVQQLRRQLTRIDPAAMSDEDNWWPVIVAETEAGLM